MRAPRTPSPPPDRPDFSTVESVSQRLLEASDRLAAMTADVANARQIREFAGDRRKRSLALAVREFLIAGDSASAAETKGRASAIYGEELDKQARAMEIAERMIAEHDAERIKWESARSLLSTLKMIANNV